jgi:hypothetical protein
MDWNLVSIEEQLDREKEKSAPTTPAAPTRQKSRLSFTKILLFIGLGILIFRLFGELLLIFK